MTHKNRNGKAASSLVPGDIISTGETVKSVSTYIKGHPRKVAIVLEKNNLTKTAVWGKSTTIFLKDTNVN